MGGNANLLIERKYDVKNCRHYMNSSNAVLHCHHYTTLYTQLAIDAEETELLAKVAEESFYKLIFDSLKLNSIDAMNNKAEFALKLFSELGLGEIEIGYMGKDSGEFHMPHSHVDSGWVRKWGQYDRPVNYIGAGYISAMFSAIRGEKCGVFRTVEWESIAMGAARSLFRTVRK